MGRPDPSAREIMGNRQAGQSCSLCLHSERRDGVRGHPQMCSGDGILSDCLNKASPSPVLPSLCHLCIRPLCLSLRFSCFHFSFLRLLMFGEVQLSSHSLLYDVEISMCEIFVELLPLMKEKENLTFDALKLFSTVEYIKGKLN